MILRETQDPQIIRFTPSVKKASSFDIVNEETRETTTYQIDELFVNTYFCQFSKIIALKEGYFYKLKVYNNTDVVYYGKIFCTNQDTATYSINKDKYIIYEQ